jgi:hypothetical protein
MIAGCTSIDASNVRLALMRSKHAQHGDSNTATKRRLGYPAISSDSQYPVQLSTASFQNKLRPASAKERSKGKATTDIPSNINKIACCSL